MGSDFDRHVGTRQGEQAADIQQITHDLNNQVMVIQGNASLLRMKAAEWPEICELAEQILSASQRATLLTKQLTEKMPRAVPSARQI